MENDFIHKKWIDKTRFFRCNDNIPLNLIHNVTRMLTKDDLEQIRGVVRAEIEPIHSEIGHIHSEMGQVHSEIGQIHSEMDQVHSEISQVRSEIGRVRDGLRAEIAEFVENSINPQFEELRREIQFVRSHMITRFDLEDRLADFRLSLKGAV